MNNEDCPLTIISMDNGDKFSPPVTQKNATVTGDEIEHSANKRIRLDLEVCEKVSVSENRVNDSSVSLPQPAAEPAQKSPFLNEFMDPVLLDRLKGTIRLKLQGSISQNVKGLLNAMQVSVEELNGLKKTNFDLQRRIIKIEKITQKVQELVSERVPPAPSSSQNNYYVIEASSNGAVISTLAENAPLNGEVPQSTTSEVIEVAPLPEIDRNYFENEPTIPPVQPPLKINLCVSSEGKPELSLEIEQVDYAYEPAKSYEIYSYGSNDVTTRTDITSALWRRIGGIDAIPLPVMCHLDFLDPGNVYYFAVFSIDQYGRNSEWSNVAALSMKFSS